MSLRDTYDAFDALYAELPEIDCKGLCENTCRLPMMSRVEAGRVNAYANRKPKGAETGVCPVLRAGRCTVHPVRPMVCRLYGCTEEMRCPHGCEPTRMLSVDEGRALLARAYLLGE
jgi:Fe-S-cluster containining protein